MKETPDEKKLFECPDCGKTVEVSKFSNNIKRCPECSKTHKANLKRESDAKLIQKYKDLRKGQVFKCEVCGNSFSEDIRKDRSSVKREPPRFCSEFCARSVGGHFNKDKRVTAKCDKCGKEILVSKNASKGPKLCDDCNPKIAIIHTRENGDRRVYTSTYKYKCNNCGKLLNSANQSGLCFDCYIKSDEYAEKQKIRSARMQGTVKWYIQSGARSKAELFMDDFLKQNNIDFNTEVKYTADKRHRYKVDFEVYKRDKKIDLEIDGPQHKTRKESDDRRDEFFRSIGHIIYRIKAQTPITKSGKRKLEAAANEFLTFYNSL